MHKSNNTRLALLIRASYQRQLAHVNSLVHNQQAPQFVMPDFEKESAVAMLVEIGTEKLMKDYMYKFIGM